MALDVAIFIFAALGAISAVVLAPSEVEELAPTCPEPCRGSEVEESAPSEWDRFVVAEKMSLCKITFGKSPGVMMVAVVVAGAGIAAGADDVTVAVEVEFESVVMFSSD
jgi:hypothetical protein